MKKSQSIDRFSKAIWKCESDKFEKLISKSKIPNSKLSHVDYIKLKDIKDFEKIPDGGGCYWIWTNEQVFHKLHKHPVPQRLNDGEIIYNGIAKDSVKSRLKHHLLGQIDASWSGISLDIYMKRSKSHRKKAMGINGKLPFIDKLGSIDYNKPITSIARLLNLHLTRNEKAYIIKKNYSKYYFINGVNIFSSKHKKHIFRVYFITAISQLYLEYLEKQWRLEYGLPKLCSYSSGR